MPSLLQADQIRRAILLASVPAIVLAVCPLLASPFAAAKGSVLLAFGALACWLVRDDSAPASQSCSTDPHFPRTLVLLCLAGWIAALLIATLVAQGWVVGWRPFAEIGSAVGVALAMRRLRVRAESLVGAIAVSSLVLSFAVLLGWFGFDLPWLFGGAAAPGRMRSAGTLGNPLFVASFLSSTVFSVCGWTRHRSAFRWGAAGVLLLALAATGERTALAGICAGGVCWLVSARTKPARKALHAALLLGAVALACLALRASNPRGIEVTAQGRSFLWKTSLHDLRFAGTGPGSFYARYTANLLDLAPTMPEQSFHFVAYEDQAHNVFVQQIVEAGVVGTLFFSGLFAAWFRLAWKQRGQIEVRVAMAGVAAFLGAGIFDNPLSRPEGLLLLACWMVVPMLPLARKASNREERSSVEPVRSWKSLRPLLAVCSAALTFSAAINLVSSHAIFSGESAEDLAQWTRAKQQLRLAIAVDPAATDARFDLVRVLCEAGEYEPCWRESECALPWVNEAELHLLRVRALEAMRRDSAAANELAAARRTFPWSKDLRSEQGFLLFNKLLPTPERNR